MPAITYGERNRISPRWAQEQLDRHSLIQGGGFLEKAQFTLPNTDGINVVYNGTLIGRTYAEKEAGIGFGIADLANDDQIFLVVHDVDFDNHVIGKDGHCTLYRHGMQVREEMLPGWATATAAYKAKIRELYTVV